MIRAETLFAHFSVEHSKPISAADHAGELVRKMSPGNPEFSIAKQYACGRTKVTAIVKKCAGDHATNLANAMRNGPFVLVTDRSWEGGEKFCDMKFDNVSCVLCCNIQSC